MTKKCAICGNLILPFRTICHECIEEQRHQEEEINIEIAKTRARLIPEILWEKRRYEIAKDMLAAFLSNSCSNVYAGTKENQAKDAVEYADALIAELRKEVKE